MMKDDHGCESNHGALLLFLSENELLGLNPFSLFQLLETFYFLLGLVSNARLGGRGTRELVRDPRREAPGL